MEVIISLEDTCDLTQQQIKKYNLNVLPMNFMIDNNEFSTATDNVKSSKLYEKMKLGSKTTTSQINQASYEDFFKNLLKQNKKVLHLAFSGALSSTYSQAKKAAQAVDNQNSIYVCDTLCACSGQGLLAILVAKKANECSSFDELIEYTENIKNIICHNFTVSSLKYLASGGRIKSSSALLGNMLNIKPLLRVDNLGKLVTIKKVVSRKKAIKSICQEVIKGVDNSCDLCFISHADCYEEALQVKTELEKNTNLKPIINNLGAIIGCHSGPGTLAIFYLGKTRWFLKKNFFN